jgi:hypothetical protein
MKKPFTSMLAELSIYLGNKLATPTSSTEIDALDDKDDDKVGGMELPADQSTDDLDVPEPEQIGDLDDKETDLSKLSLDQIIAALMALKTAQQGEQDIGGQRIDAHDDFADVDQSAPPENINPADNRMPDEGQLDDEGIPSLPGLRKSVEDEQLAGSKKKDPFGDDEDPDQELEDPKGPSFASLDADPSEEGKGTSVDLGGDPDELDSSNMDGGIGKDTDETQGLGPDGEDKMGSDMGTEDQPDENHMGSIRAVKGAHLVYKRQAGDGTFSELWMYNIGDHINNAIETKKAIIAGTDIGDNKMQSDDGSQSYELTTMGNAQLIKISGLPN